MDGLPCANRYTPYTRPPQRRPLPTSTNTASTQPPETGALTTWKIRTTGITERWPYPPERPMRYVSAPPGWKDCKLHMETREMEERYADNFSCADAAVVETMWQVARQHDYLYEFESLLNVSLKYVDQPAGWQQQLIDDLYVKRRIYLQFSYQHHASKSWLTVQSLHYVRSTSCDIGYRKALISLASLTGLPTVLVNIIAEYARFELVVTTNDDIVVNRHTRNSLATLFQQSLRDPANNILRRLLKDIVNQGHTYGWFVPPSYLLTEPLSLLADPCDKFIAMDTAQPLAPDVTVVVECDIEERDEGDDSRARARPIQPQNVMSATGEWRQF